MICFTDKSRSVRLLALFCMVACGALLSLESVHAELINEWEPILPAEMQEEGLAEQAKSLIPGRHWREPLSDMPFIWVPPGCYAMGSGPGVTGRARDEGPVHKACVSGFWMAQTEMTQGQWRRLMQVNPSHFRKGDDFPVERVAWEDIDALLRKLNLRYPGDHVFALPSEAEWEYACRNAGKRMRYAGGESPGQVAWFRGNNGTATQPVASRQENALGLFDLSGNVWEWTREVYDQNAYAKHRRQDPELPESNIPYRVIRGGGWQSMRDALRCSNRGFEHYATQRSDLGLRLVIIRDRSPKPPAHKTNSKLP